MTNETSYRIKRLQSENIKRLHAVDIVPEGNLIVIGGKNGAGKTCCLDSIAIALGGKAHEGDQVIREGQERAEVVCTLIDADDRELVIKRVITHKTDRLTVTTSDGASYTSPQAMLDAMTGALTFDPLGFSRLTPRQQVDELKELAGLNFTELDFDKTVALNERLGQKRMLAALESRLAAIDRHDDTPDEEVRIASLLDTIRIAEAKAATREGLMREVHRVDSAIIGSEMQIETLRNQLKASKEDLLDLTSQVRGIPEVTAELAELQEQLSGAEDVNRRVRANQEYDEVAGGIKARQAAIAMQSEALLRIESRKAALIGDAKWPVEGMGFADSGVTYQSLPLANCSSAEQLRIAVSMAIAMNAALNVMLIRDGSLLDANSLRLICEMADAANVQVWMERVGDGAECQVIIEDGYVQGAERLLEATEEPLEEAEEDGTEGTTIKGQKIVFQNDDEDRECFVTEQADDRPEELDAPDEPDQDNRVYFNTDGTPAEPEEPEDEQADKEEAEESEVEDGA